jgi:hypothetical protein
MFLSANLLSPPIAEMAHGRAKTEAELPLFRSLFAGFPIEISIANLIY